MSDADMDCSLGDAEECPTCDGNGWTVEGPNYYEPYGDKIDCADCGGRGMDCSLGDAEKTPEPAWPPVTITEWIRGGCVPTDALRDELRQWADFWDQDRS